MKIQMIDGVLTKKSMRHEGKKYLYWWDIDPKFLEELRGARYLGLEKKDSRQKCLIAVKDLIPLLVPERQSSRKLKSWGLKILEGREKDVILEGPTTESANILIQATWLKKQGT